MDLFSQGFVEILAAEQTPDNPNWFQGTADAVRQAARHFARHEADYYVILAGDHLYRMDYSELVDAHIDRQADITIAAQPVSTDEASSMGILHFDRKRPDRRVRGKAERRPPRRRSAGAFRPAPPLPAMRRTSPLSPRWASTCFRATCCSRRSNRTTRRISAAASFRTRSIATDVQAHLFRGYWADVGTIDSFYDANIMLTQPGAPFSFYDPRRPIYTRPRFLPGARLADCAVRDAIIAEGCDIDRRCAIERNPSSASGQTSGRARASRRSVLLGADFYESDDEAPGAGTIRGSASAATSSSIASSWTRTPGSATACG